MCKGQAGELAVGREILKSGKNSFSYINGLSLHANILNFCKLSTEFIQNQHGKVFFFGVWGWGYFGHRCNSM